MMEMVIKKSQNQKRRALMVAGGLALIGAGSVYLKQQQQRRRGQGRDANDGKKGNDDAHVVKFENRKKKKKNGSAVLLHKLVPMLVKIVGRKVLVVLGLSLCKTLLTNRLAKLQGYLFRAAFLRRVPLFVRNIAENVMLCGVAAGLEATMKSWMSLIELTWRGELTEKLQKRYFENMNYYKLNYVDRRIETPDQRICEDIPKLTSGLADLFQETMSAVVDAVFYSYQLKKYSGTHGYTAGVMGYVIGVGTFMTVAAPNFGGLYKKQQELEGKYRNLHNRLKQNSEAIAFYNGTEKEGTLVKSSYAQLVRHTDFVLGKQWRFSMVQDFLLKYLGATVAVALIIGPFFGGHLRPEATVLGRAQMLSNMRYHTSVIISLFGALGTIGSSSRKILKLGAFADRIEETFDVLKDIAVGQGAGGMLDAHGTIESSDTCIEFDKATVVTPGNAELVKDLSLKVPLGVNLLVTGPNGSGKSSLFRVLGGLWPLTEGSIRKPGGDGEETGLSHEIFYVPQRPYVAVGTLQEQLLYPLTPSGEFSIVTWIRYTSETEL